MKEAAAVYLLKGLETNGSESTVIWEKSWIFKYRVLQKYDLVYCILKWAVAQWPVPLYCTSTPEVVGDPCRSSHKKLTGTTVVQPYILS